MQRFVDLLCWLALQHRQTHDDTKYNPAIVSKDKSEKCNILVSCDEKID